MKHHKHPFSFSIAVAVAISTVLGLPALHSADTEQAWGHLIFNEDTNPLQPVMEGGKATGKSIALLVDTEDDKSLMHRANSTMARIMRIEYNAGTVAGMGPADGFTETLVVVESGEAGIKIDNTETEVSPGDMIYIPAGKKMRAEIAKDAPLKLVVAQWSADRVVPSPNMPPVVRSLENTPFSYFNEGGYVGVTPSPRQKETGLAIIGMGGHTRYSGSLMYYPKDLPTRNFTANTFLIRSAISQYGPDGGTMWHSHPDREQAFFVLSGRALLEIGATTREVKAGELIYAPKHVGHGYKVLGESPFRFVEMEWGHDW